MSLKKGRLAGVFFAGILLFFPLFSANADYCGDGIKQTDEECDDGNFNNNDGCSAYCKLEDITPPRVLSVSIPDGATEISNLTSSIDIVFSKQIDPKSLAKDVSVRFEYNGKPLDFSYLLSEDGKTLTIKINQKLTPEASQAIRLKNLRDVMGIMMDGEFISVFTTGAEIDVTPPNIVIDPPGGTYNFAQNVSLTPYVGDYTKSDDFIDTTAKIYYTLNNTDISVKSTLYTSPLSIRTDTVLRYFGVDAKGNKTDIVTQTYKFQCPDYSNAKTVNSNYPTCKIVECANGYTLLANSCVISLSTSPDDYKANAVTAPLFSSSTPITITSKPAIYITPEHNGIIPRPVIFKELKRGTVIRFEQNTKVSNLDGSPFTGYITNPENLSIKDYPINYGYVFRSIFQFKAAEDIDLQFSPPITMTIPYADNYTASEGVTIFTYDTQTKMYTEYSHGLYNFDLTKKEVAITAYKTGIFFIAQNGTNYNKAVFTDVSSSHWAKNYIEELYREGIVQGRDNGIFAPDESITRAEFVKIALSSIGETASSSVTNAPFPDVPLFAWYAPYVAKAKNLGLISGRPDGTFGPDDNINRAEALKILLNAFNFDLTKKPAITSDIAKQRFIDLPQDSWYYQYANFAIQNGIVDGTGSENNTFRFFKPSEYITRAEMAKLAVLSMNMEEEK